MQLLAASYENIGPLVERPVLLNVLPGATLITAPIGTGKSFLFFDGPLFGLYKLQNRPVLNRLATRGSVRVVFSDKSEVLRAVNRIIKRSPAGAESVQTRIFSLSWSLEVWLEFARMQWGDEVIVHGQPLDILVPHLEEHLCGSQRETDQAILDLLPPKEVMLSLNFLVQEADSVFDLTPVERVQVFKHLFGLLGIDEAKETLLERRRQTQASLKLLADQTPWDAKLRLYMQRITQANKQLTNLLPEFTEQGAELLQDYLSQSFLHDSDLFSAELRMRGDVVTGYDKEKSTLLVGRIEQTKSTLLEQQGRQEAYKKQAQELDERIHMIEQRAKEIDRNRQVLLTENTTNNEQLLLTHQAQKETLLLEIDQLEKNFPLQGFAEEGEIITFEQAKERVEQRKQSGQLLKQQQLANKETLIQLDEQISIMQTQCEKGTQQITALTLNIEKSEQFHCDKIAGDCPYVSLIKGATVSSLRIQLTNLQETLQTSQTRLDALHVRKNKELGLGEALQKEIDMLLERFKKVPHNELTTQSASLSTLRNELAQVEQKYMILMQQQATVQKRLQERASLDASFQQTQENLQDLREQQIILQAKRTDATQSPAINKQLLENTKQHIDAIALQYMLLEQLVDERTVAQITLKKLEQQDVMLKQLIDIFSKELLYVVLDDFLPQLETLINAFLAQMVEYTIHFYLPQASDEKMELAIEVHDEKGKRPVKSLSGGQKSILKFAWIMAVTGLFQAKFVFLDETMNSLDAETIAQVAQVLQDALIQKDIPFYCVTHAPQIQALPFRKRKIVLSL